ncbi:MAG: tyrosine-type recombinase/integrase [Sedimentisphaerales bacterium]|nr:tyrosine-type recombinase/integrase [Sedimentisphaerales bacterium]
MAELVRLWKRPTHDGKRYTYYLIYYDEDGRRRQKALGHADKRKAERQQAQFERELRMGKVEPESMRLSEFLEDSLSRSRGQLRYNTLRDYMSTMKHFIKVVGDIDYRSVKQRHGERFIQASLDHGNTPATASKKVVNLKRLYQLAVERGQLDENPFRYLRKPKVAKRSVRVFSEDECHRMIAATQNPQLSGENPWELLIQTALCTGMRRGELLNTTWRDIDFERQVIHVSPKRDTKQTWEWNIKDTDRRTLPLTDELIRMLADRQAAQPEGYPYVFISPSRYDRIQRSRLQGKWNAHHGNCPLNNFNRGFRVILKHAGIEDGEFHDLRRTCLTNWFAHGLSEFDVMNMAGHANFETTRKFYLAISDDLLERTRKASTEAMKTVAKLLQVPSGTKNQKGRQA